jgi:hypothetical protein
MASALTRYRTLPKPLAQVVDQIAVQIVAQWAEAYAAKARGTKLGGHRGVKLTRKVRQAGTEALSRRSKERAADLFPVIAELKAAGVTSLAGIARALTERNIPTARGSKEWTATQVGRALSRLQFVERA